MKRQLVIGIGTGRCGTLSLVKLLNQQPDALVTHERRPLLPWNRNAPRGLIRGRFLLMLSEKHRIVGDVAYYYLPYLEEILELHSDARVICLKRDREEVVRSFCRWIDSRQSIPTNNWIKQPSLKWAHDPVWAPCLPKYEGLDSREDCIRRYWDEYHQEVDRLMEVFPGSIRVFETNQVLNSQEGIRELLSFIGIPEHEHQISTGYRANRTGKENSNQPQTTLVEGSPEHCAILVPFQRQVVPNCESSLKVLERKGYPVWRVKAHGTMDQVRSQLATDALLQGFTETLWIDPDIGFDPTDVERLRKHQLPITCGIYPQVSRQGLACHIIPGTSQVVFGRRGSLQEIMYASAGFLHVRRYVYETIQQELVLPLCNERFDSPVVPFFLPLIRHDVQGAWLLAEDDSFCHRARQCGFKIMADTSIRLVRYGEYAYSWEDAGMEKQRFATFHYSLSNREKKLQKLQ